MSHTQLESCLANPRAWYRDSLQRESHPYMMGYERVLRLSIFYFHKSSASAAGEYLSRMVQKHNLKNVTRINEIEGSLAKYIKWATKERLKVADTKMNIALQVGFLELRGEIGRVDVTSMGYRAVLLGKAPPSWEKQLRMPLIQEAVASMYGRPQERTEVGFQELDASMLVTKLYNEREIQRAEQRFMALGRMLRRISDVGKPPTRVTGP